MLGKQKCKILKEIRQRIADENDIPYVTSECRHQGHCSGTCPKCESELRYLENQLQKRASLGKKVTVAALCAGMALGAAGCDAIEDFHNRLEATAKPEIYVIEGEEAMPDVQGMLEPMPTPTPEEEFFELEGDVPYENYISDLSGYVPED